MPKGLMIYSHKDCLLILVKSGNKRIHTVAVETIMKPLRNRALCSSLVLINRNTVTKFLQSDTDVT
jgi:hypothetical protein